MRAGPVISSFADAVAVAVGVLERELAGSAVWVGHLDSERAVLRVVAAGGDASFGLDAGAESPLETSFCQVMASQTGSPLCNDVAADAVYGALPANTVPGVGSFAGMPLRLGDGSSVGTLCAFHRDRGAYSERELALVGAFAAFLARELEHARGRTDLEHVVADLRRQASTDALTGAANRRSFSATLEDEWRRAADEGSDTSVAIVDLDRFKTINDRFGHAAGDAALVAVAEALRAAGEPGDVVARLGGDEFAVLIARADPAHWWAAVQRGLDGVSGRLGFRVAASLGHARLAGAGSASAALAAADAALYARKRSAPATGA